MTKSSAILVSVASVFIAPIAVYVQLASGFEFEAFGVWQPPNSQSLQVICGWLAGVATILAFASSVYVVVSGDRTERWIAVVPLLIAVLYVGISVYGYFN